MAFFAACREAAPPDRRRNCLNTVRLFAALSVTYGHVVRHLQISIPPLRLFGLRIDVQAALTAVHNCVWSVPLFFFLSGFLLWNSTGDGKRFPEYLKNRGLRIFPELWAAVALELLSIVLLFKGRISWPLLGLFGLTQGTVLQFWMPEFLRSFGCGTPNGSLWTISLTLQFYLLAWPLLRLLRRRPLWVWLALLAGLMGLAWVSPWLEALLPGILFKLYRRTVLPYLWIFLLGSFCASRFDRVVGVLRWIWPLLFGLLALWTYGIKADLTLWQYPLVGSVLFCAASVGFAYGLPGLDLKTDISYGVYIYHMIIVNGMLELGFLHSGWSMLTAFVLSIAAGIVSTLTVGRIGKRRKAPVSPDPGTKGKEG